MRWITKGNSRYLQDGAGLQETSNTHLKVTIFTTCHSSISAERWGRVRSITSGWWSNQYARLVNPRKKYISTGIREHSGWWIHGDDVWVQSLLGHGGWAHLHSPSALPMSSIVLLCVLFCIFSGKSKQVFFLSSVTVSIDLLNMKVGSWTPWF